MIELRKFEREEEIYMILFAALLLILFGAFCSFNAGYKAYDEEDNEWDQTRSAFLSLIGTIVIVSHLVSAPLPFWVLFAYVGIPCVVVLLFASLGAAFRKNVEEKKPDADIVHTM